MTEIKNQTGTKKKLLIPVVVLMLLGVGLTGAAYAYSTTVTVGNNSVEADALSINLATPSSADVTTNQKIVTFTDNFAWSKNGNNWVETNDIMYDLKSPVVIGTYKIKVTGDATWTKFNVTSTNLLTTELFSGKTVGNLFNITYTVRNADNTQDVVAASALGTAVAKGDMAIGFTYTIVLTATAVNSQTYPAHGLVEHVADATDANANDAAHYADLFDSIAFQLVFEANDAA